MLLLASPVARATRECYESSASASLWIPIFAVRDVTRRGHRATSRARWRPRHHRLCLVNRRRCPRITRAGATARRAIGRRGRAARIGGHYWGSQSSLLVTSLATDTLPPPSQVGVQTGMTVSSIMGVAPGVPAVGDVQQSPGVADGAVVVLVSTAITSPPGSRHLFEVEPHLVNASSAAARVLPRNRDRVGERYQPRIVHSIEGNDQAR